MAQSNRGSIKRGKSSYLMPVIGVTLVLFVLGFIGMLVINGSKLSANLKESIEVKAFIRGNPSPADSAALMQYMSAKPYIREINFVTKEEGKKQYLSDGNDDWDKVLTENPLPNGIFFKVKKEYLTKDSLAAIRADLEQQTYITDVQYPEALVDKMNENLRKFSIIGLFVAILLSIIVIVLIDNTIRLAMFSNRFLIKTMQMVGATRGFIARPMNMRAILFGALSGLIASVGLYMVVLLFEGLVKEAKAIRDNNMLFMLFAILIVLGICITLVSTHRSVMKYLRMKLDDLY